jgi:hypothetical protein
MAGQSPQLELVNNNLLRVYHPQLLSPSSYMTVEKASGQTAITLANNDGYADNDPVLFEGFNNPLAEIKDVTASPTYGTAIAVSATTFAHGINTPVYRLPFDQIEVSGTDTTGGVKTTIATIDINPTAPYTEYNIAGETSYAYYYVRFYNSFDSSPYHGAYSDEIESTDFGSRTVGFIRRQAFQNIGSTFEGWLTPQWIYDNIYFCEVDVMKEKETWGQLSVLDYDLGNVTVGMRCIAMPTDIDITKTNRGIIGVRVGVDENLDWFDWKEYQEEMSGVGYTTVASTGSVGASTVVLTDSSDFDDEGTLYIYDGIYNHIIQYTTNDRTTNTLGGFTFVSVTQLSDNTILSTQEGTALTLAYEITASGYTWQNMDTGTPTRFTINNGYIYFDVPISSDYIGRNIWIDYFKTASRPNSDGAEVLFNDSELYVRYLEMKIKKRRNNGVLAMDDDSFIRYEQEKKKLLARDKAPYTSRIIPIVP